MRFMIPVKTTRDSENGALPSEALFAAMAEFHEALAKAGVPLDASACAARRPPIDRAR